MPTSFAPDPVSNTQLLERVVRVEEELRAQRELMIVKFDSVDRRFEAMDQRFEAMDQRFVAQSKAIDDRFDAVNRNIGTVKWFIVTSFVVIGALISLVTLAA